MRDYTSEDKAMRKRLESRSHAGTRADIAGILNKIAAGDASNARVGLSSYLLLMMASQAHSQEVKALNKAHDRGGFNRLHPDSRMQRRVAASQSYVPELRAEQVRDAEGRMVSDARTKADFEPRLTVEAMAKLAIALTIANRYW